MTRNVAVRSEVIMKALQLLSILLVTIAPDRANAWGDDGHKIIAHIAQSYLEPAVETKIEAMLKADPDNLTPARSAK